VAATDAAAAALVGSHERVGLVGGDLCRTLGGRGSVERLTSPEAVTFPVDALAVSLDGGPPRPAVAHVLARTWGWRRVFVAMNAQWLGEWNVAPRGHPDDGKMDTLAWNLSWQAARQVLARMRLGTHLPHPGIAVTTTAVTSIRFDRARWVWIDGVRVGRARALTVVVEPDAVRVVV
jgi:diacylglycerol kinase family enzyme